MDKQERPVTTPERGAGRAAPRWTFLEVFGLLISAMLVIGPLLSLGYAFFFPSSAPAQELLPSPTPAVTVTGTPPTATPTVPTSTPTDTPTPGGPTATATDTPIVPTETVTPTPSDTPSGAFTVSKAANKSVALLGEEVVFTIGLSNGSGEQVQVTVNDTVPGELTLESVWHTCPAGSVSQNGNSFSGTLTVPAQQACQVVAVTVVNDACSCYVVNSVGWTASWTGGGDSGTANSQPVLLSDEPTPTPTITPTPPVAPTTTSTPEPGGPTGTPTATPTPTQPGPTVTTTPTATPTPTGPTSTPTPTPTGPTATPSSPTPTVTRPSLTPTEAPGAPTQPPPPPPERRTPTPIPPTAAAPCAQVRVSGETCAAATIVEISSCCPEWRAQTTANAAGHFEFAALLPGTYTVSARGRSRTVTVTTCDGVVTVNLCPATARPVTPVTVVPSITPTTAITPTVIPPTAAPVEGTQPPTTGEITLQLEANRSQLHPGESVVFFVTLQNNQGLEMLQNVVVSAAFSDSLVLQGASAVVGSAQVVGQEVSLSVSQVAAGQNLRLHVDAYVRLDARPGTTLAQQAIADADDMETVYSNYLQIPIVGGTVEVPLGAQATAAPGTTPAGPGPGGGPEPQPVPTVGPGGLGGALPSTSAGMPMVGVLLGGVVLLARQVRLRRSARDNE